MSEPWRWPSSLTLTLMVSLLAVGVVVILFSWAETAFRVCDTAGVGCVPDFEGTFPWVTAAGFLSTGSVVTLAVWGWQRIQANGAGSVDLAGGGQSGGW